jgi:PAS domain S-box-containing protein
MRTRVNFEQPKQDHLAWKVRVRKYIDGDEDMETSDFVTHFTCRMGKWFYSEGKQEFGHLEPIQQFELKHIKLHKLAKDIYEFRLAGDETLIEELYIDLVETSNQIVNLLTDAENILNQGIEEEMVPEVISNEYVIWDKSKVLITTTDDKGIIDYSNDVYSLVSGYETAELTGSPHSIVRHPDMPKVIFHYMWNAINEGKNHPTFVKNKSKSGKGFWVLLDFKINKDQDGKLISITSKQKGTDLDIIQKFIEPLYKTLLAIEKKSGERQSEKYLIGFLEERNRTFDEYTQNLLMTGRDSFKITKKGFFARLFDKF